MGEKLFYSYRDAEHVLVQIIKRAPRPEAYDETLALYVHGRYGNLEDDPSKVAPQVRQELASLGVPLVRDRVFALWQKTYRRSDLSRQQFILKIQHDERQAFGKNHLAELLNYRRN